MKFSDSHLLSKIVEGEDLAIEVSKEVEEVEEDYEDDKDLSQDLSDALSLLWDMYGLLSSIDENVKKHSRSNFITSYHQGEVRRLMEEGGSFLFNYDMRDIEVKEEEEGWDQSEENVNFILDAVFTSEKVDSKDMGA